MDQNLNDSCNSTPFVSAPSSPNRETLTAFYHSAPSSPMHFLLSTTPSLNPTTPSFVDTLFEFHLPSTSVPSADELFLNGQIRRRTRSFDLRQNTEQISNPSQNDEERSSTPRSSSAGRNSSKKWVFLKEFLSRSKSEGRNNQDRHKKLATQQHLVTTTTTTTKKCKGKTTTGHEVKKKTLNNSNSNKNLVSAHELHYTTKRAQAEEMRKRTFLPYRQGLLSCLSFGSKGYGFAKAFNPVSSTSLGTT